jgi:predicted secreted protein
MKAAAIPLLLLAACATAQPEPAPELVTEAQEGRSIAADVGATFVVRLSSNGTTGYVWQVDELPRHLTLLGEMAEAPPMPIVGSPIAGGGGSQTFEFSVTGTGRGTLRLAYRQPWNEGAAPADRFTLTVVGRTPGPRPPR